MSYTEHRTRNENSEHGMGIMKYLICILLSVVSSMLGFGQQVEIRGIYGNPKPFWEQGLKLKDLGVNAIFCP